MPINGFKDLIEYIRTYESDTFSSSRVKLTTEQAEAMANLVVRDAADSLDGIALSEHYTTVSEADEADPALLADLHLGAALEDLQDAGLSLDEARKLLLKIAKEVCE